LRAHAGRRSCPEKASGGMRAAAYARHRARGSCGRGAGSRKPPHLHPYWEQMAILFSEMGKGIPFLQSGWYRTQGDWTNTIFYHGGQPVDRCRNSELILVHGTWMCISAMGISLVARREHEGSNLFLWKKNFLDTPYSLGRLDRCALPRQGNPTYRA
jgi:hypothetical protein